MNGFVTGKVVSDWDADHPGKVKVEYLLGMSGEMTTDWIPVMTPLAGASYGRYELPGVGDLVMILFEQGNANRPVIIGCQWSQSNPMPADVADQDNSKKLFKSKTGYTVLMDEKEKKVSFSDPESKNTAVWSTQEKSLTVNAEEKIIVKINGEDYFTYEKGKVTAVGPLTMAVSGPLDITAESIKVKTEKDFNLEASGEAVLKGENITLSPKETTMIKGNAAEITSSNEVKMKTTTITAEGTDVVLKGTSIKLDATEMEMEAKISGKVKVGGLLKMDAKIIELS